MARRAEGALLAAEGDQPALRAVVTAEAGEAVAKDASPQVVPGRVRDEAGERALAAGSEVPLEPLAEELVQAFARVPALADRRRPPVAACSRSASFTTVYQRVCITPRLDPLFTPESPA